MENASIVLVAPEDLDVFDFSEALRRLRKSVRVSRAGWRTNGKWLEMYLPPRTTLPTLLLCKLDADGASVSRTTYAVEQVDILSSDWQDA